MKDLVFRQAGAMASDFDLLFLNYCSLCFFKNLLLPFPKQLKLTSYPPVIPSLSSHIPFKYELTQFLPLKQLLAKLCFNSISIQPEQNSKRKNVTASQNLIFL
jgi:hypothetical protein